MKPIIMSTEDARGILGGRKTMARKPIRTPHGGALEVHADIAGVPRLCERCGDRCRGLIPPYEVGDVLWVRETWAKIGIHRYLYQADGPEVNVQKIRQHYEFYMSSKRWMSPVTMPRSAARLFLRVTDVRVERVQDIRFTDALSEGVKPDFAEYEGRLEHPVIALANAISAQNAALVAFKKHWNARNAKRGYGWGSNPLVWVIVFEVTKEGDDVQV